jgi:hypothetical protein
MRLSAGCRDQHRKRLIGADWHCQFCAHLGIERLIIRVVGNITQEDRASGARDLSRNADAPVPATPRFAESVATEWIGAVPFVCLKCHFTALTVDHADRASFGASRIERPAQQEGQKIAKIERRFEFGAQGIEHTLLARRQDWRINIRVATGTRLQLPAAGSAHRSAPVPHRR